MLNGLVLDFAVDVAAGLLVALIGWIVSELLRHPGRLEKRVIETVLPRRMKGRRLEKWREILHADLLQAEGLRERLEVVVATLRLAANPPGGTVVEAAGVTRTSPTARIVNVNGDRDETVWTLVVEFSDHTSATVTLWSGGGVRVDYTSAGSTNAWGSWFHGVRSEEPPYPNPHLAKLIWKTHQEMTNEPEDLVRVWRRTRS